MNTTPINALTRPDGITLQGTCWTPTTTAAKGLIVLVHGFGEHHQRYTHVAAAWAAAGWILYGYDRRGHGTSTGSRGHMDSLEVELDDLAAMLAQAQQTYAGLPCVLYGHSQGGNIVLNYLLRRAPQLAGSIVTSPWLTLTTEPPAWLKVASRIAQRLLPKATIKADVKPISRDTAVQTRYLNDPLVHNQITTRAAHQTVEAGLWLLQQRTTLPCPMLLMHGTADLVTDIRSTQLFAERQSGELTTRWWEGLYHELHNEPEKAEVLDFMLHWLNALSNVSHSEGHPNP